MAKQRMYRVYCNTEADHVNTGFLSSAPTQCPNDAGHTIDTSKTAIIDSDLTLDGHSVDTGNPHGVTSVQSGGASCRTESLQKDESATWLKNQTNDWTEMATIRYAGSAKEGTYSKVIVVGEVPDTSYRADIRLQDITNTQTIASATALAWGAQDIPESKELSAPTNFPAGAAIFELQAKRNSGSGEVRLAELYMER